MQKSIYFNNNDYANLEYLSAKNFCQCFCQS